MCLNKDAMKLHSASDLYEAYYQMGLDKYKDMEDRKEAYYRVWAFCMGKYHDFLCQLEEKYPEVKAAIDSECDNLIPK